MGSEKQNKKSGIALCVCGPEGAGKTSLIHRLLYGAFIEAPQTQTTNKPIITLSASLYDVEKGKNQADIECIEAVNLHLFNPRFKKFSKNYFLNKEAVLIVLDSNNLPDAETLKTYFMLAEYSKGAIHLIINKLDEPGPLDKHGNPQKTTTSINALLTEAGTTPDYIHYISTKNNYGIKELRNYLNIPQPLAERKPAEINPTAPTDRTMAKASFAIAIGILAGGIAGVFGTPLLGIVVGLSVAGITATMLNIANMGEILAENSKQNPPETTSEPITDNLEAKHKAELTLGTKVKQPPAKIQLDFTQNADPELAARHHISHHYSPLARKHIAAPPSPATERAAEEPKSNTPNIPKN